MPTNFTRAKELLDKLIPRIKTSRPDTLDSRIAGQCLALRTSYQGRLLDLARVPIDYSKPTAAIAYVYKSLPAHADWMFKALSRAPNAISQALSKTTTRIACIGGGPGSDILGFVTFAELNGLTDASLRFTVLDREPTWDVIRDGLVGMIDTVAVSQRTQAFDFTAKDDWTDDWEFLRADVFTFSFSLSEVWCYNQDGAVSAFLDRVITEAKKGAIFVYVDNGGDSFTPLIDAEFDGRDDIRQLAALDDETMRMSPREQRSVLEAPYMSRFGGERTKMGGHVAIRIWKKL